ncbi:hypothetical protein [[Eubacterium] cellulosolvens]
MKKCKFCIENTEKDDLCCLHDRAYRNLLQTFDQWKVAYSDKITFQDYLNKLRTLSETGRAVKDVLEYMLISKDRDID